jgi:hypothetical protein
MKGLKMHHYRFRKMFIAATALALAALVFLWSFNTLAELFGGPMAQFKHAIAAVGLLLVVKWTRRYHGHNHDCRGDVCGH